MGQEHLSRELFKKNIIIIKLVLYFSKFKMCDITAQNIVYCKNELINYEDENGKFYSIVYVKLIIDVFLIMI